MGANEFYLLLGSLVTVPIFWVLPRRFAQSGVALVCGATIAALSPLSAIWLSFNIVGVWLFLRLGEKLGTRNLVTSISVALLAGMLIISRPLSDTGSIVTTIGGAYFTLRSIHVVLEWWMKRIDAPGLADYARYHLFLPIVAAGPIHRFPHFQRACERRRWSAKEFYTGAERLLFGLILVLVIGQYIFSKFLASIDQVLPANEVMHLWVLSAVEWGRLYVTFSGLTDIALGISLMMGLKLEENFNQPWKAKDLVDFWSRWHMTLSLWCRDYVFVSVSAALRSPVPGVFAAMLAMGLWHATSLYYILWAVYHAFGIVTNQLLKRLVGKSVVARLPDSVIRIFAPILVLTWLSGAKPVLFLILGDLPQ